MKRWSWIKWKRCEVLLNRVSPPLWGDWSSHFPFSFLLGTRPTDGLDILVTFFPHGSPVDRALWAKPLRTLVLRLYISITQVVKTAHSCAPAPRNCAGSLVGLGLHPVTQMCCFTISDARDQPVMELHGVSPAWWPLQGAGFWPPLLLRSDSWTVQVSSDSHLHCAFFQKPIWETWKRNWPRISSSWKRSWEPCFICVHPGRRGAG